MLLFLIFWFPATKYIKPVFFIAGTIKRWIELRNLWARTPSLIFHCFSLIKRHDHKTILHFMLSDQSANVFRFNVHELNSVYTRKNKYLLRFIERQVCLAYYITPFLYLFLYCHASVKINAIQLQKLICFICALLDTYQMLFY